MDEKRMTCQICGRPIKASKGLIAHHGYKRPGCGWQTASCAGARYLPYEVGRDRIPEVIKGIQQWAQDTQATLAAFLKTPPPELIYIRKSGWSQKEIILQKPADFQFDTCRSFGFLDYATIYRQRVREMEQGIQFAEQDILRLQKRYDNWSPDGTA